MTDQTSGLEVARTATRFAASAGMLTAGIGHLSFARKSFQAQVPDWVPISKDATVLASGVVEIGFGLGVLAPQPHRARVGTLLAAFLVAIFPGNISQKQHERDGAGLNSDRQRFVRLFFQPLMVATAWWSTRPARKAGGFGG
ncbi:hypothetical protein [uncultured Jatrophihabitans sp.]|uniref:DoxX family protein n=1 Tax=uncultured Jatrophihabitans sp. TaxID=1610747 RepID=UPI0035CA3D9D